MISNPTGVFVIFTFDAQDGWDQLRDFLAPDLDQAGMNRLRPVLEEVCRCVVIEQHYIDKDYRDTFSHFHSKRFATPPARCLRLHFFSAPVTEARIVSGRSHIQKNYLGYSVIRPTKPYCIGRTLLSHTIRLEKKAHLSFCEEKILLMGTRLVVEGFPFISQDSDATVCAQSALWMVLRYYSNRYPWYSEMLPFQITNLATHHGTGYRVYPSAGLYSWQLAEALRMQRFSPVVYSRKHFHADFDHLLYTYVESCLPLLITLKEHVIVGYGHASDYERKWPYPKAGFASSSYFNEALVVSDDGDYPYQMLREGGRSQPQHSKYAWKDIEEFIVPLPEKVFLTADRVQKLIVTLLQGPEAGIGTHSPVLKGKKLMLRLFLTTSHSFKRNLHPRGMGAPVVARTYRHLPMPHFIWVCELADFDEYRREKKVLGEIIWDATRNAHETDGWIAAHYPEVLFYDAGSALNLPQDIRARPLRDGISYSLFSANLHSI
jgi:hypothetical protein